MGTLDKRMNEQQPNEGFPHFFQRYFLMQQCVWERILWEKKENGKLNKDEDENEYLTVFAKVFF